MLSDVISCSEGYPVVFKTVAVYLKGVSKAQNSCFIFILLNAMETLDLLIRNPCSNKFKGNSSIP